MILIIVISLIVSIQIVLSNPVVNTKYGAVEGLSIPIHTGQVIDSFMAIPYAKPPVDDLRFMPAEEPDPWNSTLLAHSPGNACVQWKVNTVFLSHWGYEKFDEDCLTVNVYREQGIAELQPVLVFIHGGDFKGGANFGYPGYFQASLGVVVVTINYRLNILGFATTEDDVLPGNLGLFDQALALKFVQENIEAFGGDPNRVTISGESAGGASVGFHIISPVSEGLFQQAILQSGSELAYWCFQAPEEQPSNYLRQVAEKVDCPTESSYEMVECLKTVPAQRLVSTRYNCTEGYDCGTFRPTLDGAFITDYPMALRERKEYNKVPEMIGTNEDDGSMLMLFAKPIGLEEGLTREEFDEFLIEGLQEVAPSWPYPERLEDAMQSMRFYYTGWPEVDDPIVCRDMLSRLLTDLWFGYTADMQAKYHSDDNQVYYYVYDYTYNDSSVAEHFGTFHAAEISFTFGWPFIYLKENEIAFNHSEINPPPNDTKIVTDFDREFSTFMMKMWTNFAKYGSPTPEPAGPGDKSTISWQPFSQNNLTFAYLSSDPEVKIDYRQKDYAYWREYLRYITHGETFFLEGKGSDAKADESVHFQGRLRDNVDHMLTLLEDDQIESILFE